MIKYHGHKTFADGHHEPLTKGEVEALWQSVEEAQAKRAATMPTARDAFSAMVDARSRLHELGWWEGGGMRVRRGDECAVAETGSTGMWSGRVDADGEYVHFGGYVRKPRDCWLKPLADLTDAERAWMEECDRREAEAYRSWLDRQPQEQAHE